MRHTHTRTGIVGARGAEAEAVRDTLSHTQRDTESLGAETMMRKKRMTKGLVDDERRRGVGVDHTTTRVGERKMIRCTRYTDSL